MKAVIFGVTGQDGSYLSEFLLEKGYEVVGVSRRASTDNTERLKGVLDNPQFMFMEIIYKVLLLRIQNRTLFTLLQKLI